MFLSSFSKKILSWKFQSQKPLKFNSIQQIFFGHLLRAAYSAKECTGHRVKSLSHARLFATPWTAARQAPLSLGFSRQEYWSRLPCPPSGDLPDSGIKPTSRMSPVLAGGFFWQWWFPFGSGPGKTTYIAVCHK